MHKILKYCKSKPIYIILAVLLQFLTLFFLVSYFSQKFFIVYYILIIFSLCVCMHIINRDSDSSSKLLWVLLIMAFPIFGGLVYLLIGNRKIPKALMIKDRQAYSDYKKYALQNIEILSDLHEDDYVLDKMTSMAWSNGYFPVYENCEVTYFPSGEDQYQSFIEELIKAEDFIFMEFFIINKGVMWNTILQILMDKAAMGVDVRVIYDDMGSLTYLPRDYAKWLNDRGVKTHVFNPLRPQLAMAMNNRDHRKILVIDGKVAFTGGCNISDEYINTKKRFGHWKDMGCLIKGAGVEMFTISFLQIWNYQASQYTSYSRFIKDRTLFSNQKTKGFIIPFSDSPTDENNTGLNMHLNMLGCAKDYFWITTPYLILDSEMISSLKLAVSNGVDVRIVVPGIPDKKMVYQVTKANFDTLIKAGVKIYEYTPGFIHGKVCIIDDSSALVGTVNMDFRSYYQHYECGVWMHETDCLMDIKKDFEEIFKVCHEVTLDECINTNPALKLYRNVLKVFSPIM